MKNYPCIPETTARGYFKELANTRKPGATKMTSTENLHKRVVRVQGAKTSKVLKHCQTSTVLEKKLLSID
jgi:hypothetical protein